MTSEQVWDKIFISEVDRPKTWIQHNLKRIKNMHYMQKKDWKEMDLNVSGGLWFNDTWACIDFIIRSTEVF